MDAVYPWNLESFARCFALLIAGAYGIDETQPLPAIGGGLSAFGVRDHRNGRRDLMAVQVAADAPPRSLPLGTLASVEIENMLLPMAHGGAPAPGGGRAWYIVTPRPAGPPIGMIGEEVFAPWSERELLECLLRPAAIALDHLAGTGVTHRAIRPNNVFRAKTGEKVTLGCAWAGPPAILQPCRFEPPYVAMCHPAGRGDGSIADDIYALGVLMLMLATGRMPMEGLDDQEVIRTKLERGSFVALVGDARLSPTISDLARGMLAEDPIHRPTPVLLADPFAARSRRIVSRPTRRAQRPLEIDGVEAWDARTLAYGLARAPEQAMRLLCNMVIESWLRRSLGDPAIASRLEDVLRTNTAETERDAGKAAAALMMRVVAVLDPLAPLCWQGLAFFPDGIAPLVAHVGDDVIGRALAEKLEVILMGEMCAVWGEAHPDSPDTPAVLRLDARQHRLVLRISGWAGGFPRLRYTANPLLSCRSLILRGECVVRLPDLLPALERCGAARLDFVIDHEIAAFIAARFNGRMDSDFIVLAQDEDPDIDPPGHRGVAQLRVLGRISEMDPSASWPALAACALRSARLALKTWRGQSVRAMRETALQEAAAQGRLSAMLVVVGDDAAHLEDTRAALNAHAEITAIEATLVRLEGRKDWRAAQARNAGYEIAAAIGVMVLAVAAVSTALP